jgi:hypothetical protein
MSYGFRIVSGTGAVVENVSADTPPGVYLDGFLYTPSSTPTTKQYVGFPGLEVFPVLLSTSIFGTYANISISNDAVKTVTLSAGSLTGTPYGTAAALVAIVGT